ncbi:MAG: YbjN domain-containing protein [Actinomycetota bacterium]|nr:MAG: YbjN domain-containing protein [Actinomycetota bacterium]
MTTPAAAAATVRGYLRDQELRFDEDAPGAFVVELPGERKLITALALTIGRHAMTSNAFVVRRPDENHEAVYRWLLERNRRTYAVAFALDHHGDVYLAGRTPLAAVTADELDRVLGAVLEYADGSFNPLLEMGFATAIRREWAWRTSRGESTANLQAFTHLAGDAAPRAGVAPQDD